MGCERVLFLLLNFPRPNQAGNLYFDLVEEFRDRGKTVYVATLDADLSQPFQLSVESGVQVLRVRSLKYFNVGFIRKGLSLLSFTRNFKKAIAKAWPEVSFDLIVYPTPPLTFFSTVAYLKKRDGSKCYLILRDIFPQNAVDLGILRNQFVISYFRKMERKLYEISDRIGCMSEGNINYLLKRNLADRKKLHLLPNWKKIRQGNGENRERAASTRRNFDLEDKFVCIFGGVHGIAQDLSVMLDLAKRTESFEDVRFVFVGEGNQKKKLQNYTESIQARNVLFLDKMLPAEYFQLVEGASIGLVCLNKRFTIPNIPSKTLDFFQYKVPVLAAVDSSTDFLDILEKSGGGLGCLSSEPDKLYENFKKLYQDKNLREKMGTQGRAYLDRTSLVSHAYETIAEAVRD